MGKLVRKVGFILVLAGAGALAYRILLNDEARSSLKNSYSSIKGAYSRMTGIISDMRGIVVGEDELPNVEATRLQWEVLGF